jgi:hypothetical protein
MAVARLMGARTGAPEEIGIYWPWPIAAAALSIAF